MRRRLQDDFFLLKKDILVFQPKFAIWLLEVLHAPKMSKIVRIEFDS